MLFSEFRKRFAPKPDARASFDADLRASYAAEHPEPEIAQNISVFASRREWVEADITSEFFARMMCAVAGVPEDRWQSLSLSTGSYDPLTRQNLHLFGNDAKIRLRIDYSQKTTPVTYALKSSA